MTTKMPDGMEAALIGAVADVLQKFGYHQHIRDDETVGWTPEMAAEFAAFMEQQVARIQKPAPVIKIKPKRITLVRAEGPRSECDKPVTVDSFVAANSVLFRWSATAPKTGGYDKCDFEVEFEDGSIYSGRYDLKHHTCEPISLSKHIRDFLSYLAGTPPAWMYGDRNSERLLKQYRADIEANPERTAKAKRMLETYDLFP